MPAIPSPSMIPGGLIPFGGAPLSVPQIGQLQPPAVPVLVQSGTASTAVSGPASFTQNFPGATRVGTLLVWFVAVNASAGAALGPTPAGWTLLWSQVVATLALGCYIYPNNPGGLTSATLSGPTATTGGISGSFYEEANCPFIPGDVVTNTNGNSTTPNSSATNAQIAPPGTNNFLFGAIAWVLGAATLSFNNNAAQGIQGGFVTTAQISSTNGTTNAALQTGIIVQQASVSANPAFGFRFAGTLTASSVWAAGLANARSLATDVEGSNQFTATGLSMGDVIGGGQQAISVGSL